MFTLILTAALSCHAPTIINRTSEPLNNLDRQTIKSAMNRCKVHFPNSPCLKRFYKVRPRSYHATCGKPEENK